MAIPARLDYIICSTCTHTENSHKKFDGRSSKDRECHAYLCKCTKFIKKEK